jgi:(p)ppGpp synthase/HD superfamily hydrolase
MSDKSVQHARDGELGFLENLADKVPYVNIKEVERALDFTKAYHHNRHRKSGEPFYLHSLNVAKIVTDYTNDQDAIIAALLHDVFQENKLEMLQIEVMFNHNVFNIVNSISKLNKKYRAVDISECKNITDSLITRNKSALYIKIADRIHNMRTINGHRLIDKQKSIANETLNFFVPLATQLGLATAASELIQLSLDVLFTR